MIQDTFDVIISGGGLSGSLMALSLAGLTKADGSLLSIAIIEMSNVELNKAKEKKLENNASQNTIPLFDDRVLALSHGSAQYLKKVGAWQYLQESACAIEAIDISDRGHYGKARLKAKNHDVSALGYVIEMALIGKAQLTALSHHAAKVKNKQNIHWFTPDSITHIDWQNPDRKQTDNSQYVTVELASKKTLRANLLLACDGVNSICRQQANINVHHSDYQQVALIANVATKHPHDNKAFERFTETGPIAMLPLSPVEGNSRCSLVWTLTPELANEMMALNDDDFKKALEQAFGSWLGEVTQVGKRYSYPLVLMQAERQTYHRMALVGNASHTIHPIAGQGFNLGLRDVQTMTSLIKQALDQEQDIGSFSLLNQYQVQRQQDQKEVITLTDSLVTLFSNELPPLVLGRTIGLKVLNYLTPLKQTLVKKTMGY